MAVRGKHQALLMALAAVLLTAAVACLIWRSHVSHMRAQSLNISRLEAASRDRSEVIAYFFSERSNDIRQLAASPEVAAFFQDRAQGVSRPPGAKAVTDMFSRFIAEHRLAGGPLYQAVALMDDQCEPLILAGPDQDGKSPENLSRFISLKSRERLPLLDFYPGATHAVMGCPVVVQGRSLGAVWTLIPLSAPVLGLFRAGAMPGADFAGLIMGSRPVLSLDGSLDERGLAGLPPVLPGIHSGWSRTRGDFAPGPGPSLILRYQIPGLPLDYVAVVPESSVSPGTPMAMYLSMGGLALLCLAALAMFSRTRARHKELHARLEEKSRSERLLKRQAFQDQLTLLPNRLFMAGHLDHALELAGRNNSRAGVFMLDLDHFKEVNDTLGHQAGDEVLRLAARRIRGAVRKSDMLGRLGGDEFLLVVENVPCRECLTGLAEKVLAAMARPFFHQGLPVSLGVSIGIAVYPADGRDASTLIHNADLAMYQAKQSGLSGPRFFRPGLGARRPRGLPGKNPAPPAETQASLSFSGSWPYPAPDPGRQG